ncbi:hypothetical protein [Ornithinimicrobium murale]|uniref:hypothetical protein n=1 Tax=Ornithinimicrobium murale TaxID=1050153 RepID=UPI000E0D6C8B|nr:hypothetical protein [Ornithinimicrobium murale]
MTAASTNPYQPSDAEITAQVILAGRDLRFVDEPGSHRDRLLFDRLKDELGAAFDDATDYGEGAEVVAMIVSDSIKPISAATRAVMVRALRAEHQLDGWEPSKPFDPPQDQIDAVIAGALDDVPKPDPRIAERDVRLIAEVAEAYSHLYGDGEGEAKLDQLLTVAQKDVRTILRSVAIRALRAEAALASAEFQCFERPRPENEPVSATATLEKVRTFAQGRAITAKALGRDDREWLDLLAIIERG